MDISASNIVFSSFKIYINFLFKLFKKKFNYRDLDDVPLSKKGELKEAFKKDKYGEIDNELKIIKLGLVEKSLKEFHAKYSVKKRIDNSIPNELLKRRIWELKQALSEGRERFHNSQELGMKELSNIFLDFLIFTQEFYIFNVWNKLEVVFEEQKFNEMLHLFHQLNKILKKIIKKNRNFDGMRLDIFELAKILDKLDFGKIFFENFILEKDLISLNNFIDEF